MLKKKEEAKKLLDAYKKEGKENLINEAINLDDTNPDIVFEYLDNLRNKDRYKFDQKFSKYKLVLPQDLLSKFSEIEKCQKARFFYMLLILLSSNKLKIENIVKLLKKHFGNSKYLSYKFNQPITVENLNLFYYSIIVTIMEQIYKGTKESIINLVTILNQKVHYSIEYIKKIQQFEVIDEKNFLSFHLYFFNFLFIELDLFKQFYDSIIKNEETDYNYFSSYLKNIKEFFKEIGKSKTIISLLTFIDKSYSSYFEEIPDMIDYIFEKKLYFNNIESHKFSSLTITDTLNIYLSGKSIIPNNEIIDKKNLYMPEVIIINLGKMIITLIHEIFWHFLKLFLNKSCKYEKDTSPKNTDLIRKFNALEKTCNNEDVKKIIFDFTKIYVLDTQFQDDDEGGDQLEIFLSGDRLNDISIMESLYLLNLNNYQKDFLLFRKEFSKITEFIRKKSNFLENYKFIYKSKQNISNSEENKIQDINDNDDININLEANIGDLIDFDKAYFNNQKSFEVVNNQIFSEKKNLNEIDLANKLNIEKELKNTQKMQEIKKIEDDYLKIRNELEEQEKEINKFIYDNLAFNALLTKEMYDLFQIRDQKNGSFITVYDKIKLKTSKYHYGPKIYLGKCGTNLAKRKIRNQK